VPQRGNLWGGRSAMERQHRFIQRVWMLGIEEGKPMGETWAAIHGASFWKPRGNQGGKPGRGDGMTLLTWILWMFRKFLFDDVEQPENRGLLVSSIYL
jgi:hypothetical protein